MFYLAKVIQALGFADVGYALLVGFTEEHSMGRELELMERSMVKTVLGIYHGRIAYPSQEALRAAKRGSGPAAGLPGEASPPSGRAEPGVRLEIPGWNGTCSGPALLSGLLTPPTLTWPSAAWPA